MEIPSYTSNVQPYGSDSGTKLASKYDIVQQVSSKKEQVSTKEQSEQTSRFVEKAIEIAQEREKLSRVEREKATLELRLLHRPDYSRRRLVAVRIYKKRQQI